MEREIEGEVVGALPLHYHWKKLLTLLIDY
jgi:hypothetical protein